MKQVILFLVCIAALVSAAVGGVLADWVEDDFSGYSLEAGEWQPPDCDGTRGFWKGPGVQNWVGVDYESTIEGWLIAIDSDSGWLGPTSYADMVSANWMNCGGNDMYMKFRSQYLAQRLNQESGRQSPTNLHDVMNVDSYANSNNPSSKYYIGVENYLGLPNPYNATGWQIIQAIESKYGNMSADEDLRNTEYEIMKDVCDELNNLGI